ncbi:Angiopoietin-related protein 2-like [Homarus americanus]|uniref:Angiopoietin-related protein 2-like n=2 Tax=Homarus americanus TaxID=6706 RepID=A0A8J5K1X2_HOMAM|nr:Angiopoietin-related protein 2-like [Homarus americanus]
MHVMTKGRNHELRVNITDWSDSSAWAEWKEFSVAGESEKYRLKVIRYTSMSQAGDALKWHNGMKFSTPDRDNDVLLGGHCAKRNSGGWWYRGYRGCYQAHPTGRYQNNPGDPPKTSVESRNFELGPVLVWQNWRGESYYPKTLFLMFRPALN